MAPIEVVDTEIPSHIERVWAGGLDGFWMICTDEEEGIQRFVGVWLPTFTRVHIDVVRPVGELPFLYVGAEHGGPKTMIAVELQAMYGGNLYFRGGRLEDAIWEPCYTGESPFDHGAHVPRRRAMASGETSAW